MCEPSTKLFKENKVLYGSTTTSDVASNDADPGKTEKLNRILLE